MADQVLSPPGDWLNLKSMHRLFILFILSIALTLNAVAETSEDFELDASRLNFWIGQPASAPVTHQEKSLSPLGAHFDLILAVSTLHYFPPGHKFQTFLTSARRPTDETLLGDLYFVGHGDPSFDSERMWFLVNELSRTGIKKIKGDLVVDSTCFTGVTIEGEDGLRAECLSYNKNRLHVTVIGATAKSTVPAVYISPSGDYIKIQNESISEKKDTLKISLSVSDGQEILKISGSKAPGRNEFEIPIHAPARWAAHVLIDFLKQRGITFEGKIKFGQAPPLAYPLAHADGYSVPQILNAMVESDDLFIQNMLVSDTAALSKSSTQAEGLEVIKSKLVEMGLVESQIELNSVSRSDSANKVSASNLAKLLSDARRNFRIYPELLSALPILRDGSNSDSGSDGMRGQYFDGPSYVNSSGYVSVGDLTQPYVLTYLKPEKTKPERLKKNILSFLRAKAH